MKTANPKTFSAKMSPPKGTSMSSMTRASAGKSGDKSNRGGQKILAQAMKVSPK